MKDSESASRGLVAAPLVLGVVAFLIWLIYCYCIHHEPRYINIILLAPVLSFIGVIISIITRKTE